MLVIKLQCAGVIQSFHGESGQEYPTLCGGKHLKALSLLANAKVEGFHHKPKSKSSTILISSVIGARK